VRKRKLMTSIWLSNSNGGSDKVRESHYTEPEAKEKMRGLRVELEGVLRINELGGLKKLILVACAKEDNRDLSKLTMKKVVKQLGQQQEYYAAGMSGA
jgi:hypothetical protein